MAASIKAAKDRSTIPLSKPVKLQCVGGFALVTRYGFLRVTNDIDYLPTLVPDEQHRLLETAGQGPSLHKRFHVYIQCVGGVTSFPENCEDRLEDIFPHEFEKLRILALDSYGLALSKLERNSPKDRDYRNRRRRNLLSLLRRA
jgi:Nucleotidyltransferase of unknown function (DUF6036)